MKNKKAQITLFIIIGIVIVISVLMFIYFKAKIQGSIYPGAGYTLPASNPIRLQIERCIASTGKESIELLGSRGGYTALPKEIENDQLSYLAFGPAEFQFKQPYWWYQGINNIPSEEDLKQQISAYVTSNIKTCLRNLTSETFDIVEKGNIITKVSLNENDVSIKLTYPILIIDSINNTKTRVSDFSATVPIRLKKAYELAKAIMEMENADSFIEKKTIDLMALDNDENIPLIGMDVSCKKKEWDIRDVKQRLKELLEANLQFVKVEGTNYNENSFIYIPESYSEEQTFNKSYYGLHYVWNVMENPPEDMHVAFRYDRNWELSLSARPSNDMKLESNAQKGYEMLRYFCLHLWHFNYDVSYPVTVTIRDDREGGHDAYSFTFAFMTSIDHNQPLRANIPRTVFRARGSASNDDYCNDKYYNITIHTTDKKTSKPVEDVNLTFICGPFSCEMGQTYDVGLGADAELRTEFPLCSYGIIRGRAEGYSKSDEFYQIIQTDRKKVYGLEPHYYLEMQPVKEIKNYTVVKHVFADNVVSQHAEKLADDEKVTITIKDAESEFESYGIYPINQTNVSHPITLLAKDEYTYNITVYLMKSENVTGGYKADWYVPSQDIEDAKQVIFHVIDKGLSEKEEEIYKFMAELEKHSRQIPTPEIK